MLLVVCSTGFAQKIKFKKGSLLIDDTEWLKYTDCGTFDEACSLLNLNGEEIIFIKTIGVPDGLPRTQANPKGNLVYKQISFLGLDKKIELDKTDKAIIEILYNSKVVVNGKLDPEKVNLLVEKYGTEFSDRLNR